MWELHPLPDAWALNETVEVRVITLFNEPSELLKLSFIVTFAYHLQKVEENLNQPGVLIPVLFHAAAPVERHHVEKRTCRSGHATRSEQWTERYSTTERS